MPEAVLPKKKTREQVAKEHAKEIYGHAVCRVVELTERMSPTPSPPEVKKMLQRRFALAVDATEVFMEGWATVGKGRFAPKDD